MEPFHLAHVIALGAWLGVVITEVLCEFAGSDSESLRAAARSHYNVDKYGELPILLAVLVTGAILTVRAWPLSLLHVIKWWPRCSPSAARSSASSGYSAVVGSRT